MITTVFFDLDGTLLPMDQEVFLKAYMGGLAAKTASHGYDPKRFVPAIWKGTGAMVANDGRMRNDDLFWQVFSAEIGKDARADEPIFEDFYKKEFQSVSKACGFDPRAAEVIRIVRDSGRTAVLATNPLFPAIATRSRARWAGLDPDDFAYITTYENSYHSKPNPDYYREILEKLDLQPEECLMVGNDASEDTVPAQLGMQVFLLTDCLINKENKDITAWPHGGFPELIDYIRSL